LRKRQDEDLGRHGWERRAQANRDTKKAFGPVFTHLAGALGVDYELSATTDWAGIAVAMGSGQVDVAWMGPWGYIIASSASGCQAVATVKYDEKPIYHAIIIARPDLQVAKFPDDTRGQIHVVR
jgi:phosphonate transport system substrate-binding protein